MNAFIRRFPIRILMALTVHWLTAFEATAQGIPERAWVIIEIDDLRDIPNSPVRHAFSGGKGYALHDGTYRLFRQGEHASEALAAFAVGVDPGILRPAFTAVDPYALVDRMHAPSSPSLDAVNNVWITFPPIADTSRHRFLTYFIKICPSNDAFIANEEPIEIFDENGAFLGPITIDLFGDDVMDAGVRQNNETDIRCVDDWSVGEAPPGVPTSDPVQRHPGFNGSSTNPDGSPVRILGASGSFLNAAGRIQEFDYPVELNDFSLFERPHRPLARVRITSGVHGGFNGVYYDPNRDGEGVTLEIAGEWKNRRAVLAWYTYKPDGSGDPIYLGGVGPVSGLGETAVIELFSTAGGSFASLNNPDTVQRTPWGTVRVTFDRCDRIRLSEIQPLDPAYQAPSSIIMWRIAEPPTGLAKWCGNDVIRGLVQQLPGG